MERLSENDPVLKSHLDSNLSSRSGESVQRWKFSTTGLDFLLRDKGKMNLQKCFLFVTGPVKGILHQKNFFHLNLIFWIIMGCGIARFGRRGLKTTET